MSFTSDSILKHLEKSDYPLLNVNYDIAAVRVVGFCNQEKCPVECRKKLTLQRTLLLGL